MGLGAFACGVGGAKKAFGGFGAFGAFDGWQTAGLNANKTLLIWALVPLPAGLGVPKTSLERLDGLGGFDGLTAGIVAVASDERGKIHTFGGPRRRPCLDKGRGRGIVE